MACDQIKQVHLFQIINEHDVEQVETEKTTKDKITELVHTLCKARSDGFSKFLKALKKSELSFVQEKLETEEKKILWNIGKTQNLTILLIYFDLNLKHKLVHINVLMDFMLSYVFY